MTSTAITATSATVPQIIHIAHPNRPHLKSQSIQSGFDRAIGRREWRMSPQLSFRRP